MLNVVTGRGADIGDALVGHPDVRRVAFTGETETGRRIMALAGPQLKRVTLELGGSDPVIVCDDADVDAAVKAVIIGRYWNAGQACLGCKRVFVHEAVYDEFVGSSSSASSATSPATARSRPRSRSCGWARSTRARAATSCSRRSRTASPGRRGAHRRRHRRAREGLLPRAGGRRRAAATTRALVREEVFGPVLPVFRYSDFDEAIAPRERHALRPRLLDLDARRAQIHRAAHEIDAGMTWVNQIHYGYDELPFGGIKDSRLRQGARPRGARPLRRAQDGRRRRAGLMAVDFEPTARSARSRSTTRRPTPTTSQFMERVRGRDRRRRSPTDAAVVVVRSASEKFFSAGADVKQFLDGDVEANMDMIRVSQAAFARMAARRSVFIAHIAGHALGGGLEMALACDLRYAAEGRYRSARRRSRWACCPATAAPSACPA